MADRTRARSLANESIANGDAVGWFEQLYREAAAGTAVVPWADQVPNPHVVAWLERNGERRGRALDVGSGAPPVRRSVQFFELRAEDRLPGPPGRVSMDA